MFDLFIHNFRSFQNQKFEFSRVNILIGENSGGKSSLLKFLLSLKQTLDSPTESNLKLRGDFTDLGNYEEVIFNRQKKKKLEFGFSSSSEYVDFAIDFFKNNIVKENDEQENRILQKLLTRISDSKTSILFTLNSELNDHSNILISINNDAVGKIDIRTKKIKNLDSKREFHCEISYNIGDTIGKFDNCISYKEGFCTIVDSDIKNIVKNNFPENYLDFFYDIGFLLVFQNFIIQQISSFGFVNPIGNSPKRFYLKEDKRMVYKSIDIEKFINIMGDDNLTNKQQNQRMTILNRFIREFGIADEIEIIKEDQLPIMALYVKTKEFWANITDVGYGVSLQIPIIFQAVLSEFYTKYGETLLIEQPEVHLHPNLQSKFIETLLSIGNKNRYFIETHSEHIIRKLQVLVKQKKFHLKPEDISIHYFIRDDKQFKITEHKIGKDGRLNPQFPTGFFDTSYNLIKELL